MCSIVTRAAQKREASAHVGPWAQLADSGGPVPGPCCTHTAPPRGARCSPAGDLGLTLHRMEGDAATEVTQDNHHLLFTTF